MSWFNSEFWASDVTQVTLFAFVSAIFLAVCVERYYRERHIEVSAAAAFVEKHVAEMQEILRLPTVSPAIKALVLDLETLMASRLNAARVVSSLCNPQPRPLQVGAPQALFEQLKRTYESDVKFARAFRSFLETGLFAMTLRWPETRGQYVKVTVMVERESAPELTRSVTQSATKDLSASSPVPQMAYAQ